MRVTEIFYSIQGESRFAGLPCVFVRSTGCNLRCVWCDTDYAFYGGQDMPVDKIIEKVESYGCKLVELTGGEPLLQKDIYELANRLLEKNYTVIIETSGERDVSKLDPRVIKIVDIKCPSSGESQKNRWQNLEYLTPQDEVKFVVKDQKDYKWAVDVVKKHNLENRVQLVFSPVWAELELLDLAQWILQDRLKARFQVQLHKFIWSPEKRGV
ncbi:MAG: radical SAM protein [bacterium]